MLKKDSALGPLLTELRDSEKQWEINNAGAAHYAKRCQRAVGAGCSGAVLFGLAILLSAMSRGVTDLALQAGVLGVALIILGIVLVVRLGSYKNAPRQTLFCPQRTGELRQFLQQLQTHFSPETEVRIKANIDRTISHEEVSDIKLLQARNETEFYDYPREETRKGLQLECLVGPPAEPQILLSVQRECRIRSTMVSRTTGSGPDRKVSSQVHFEYLRVADTYRLRVCGGGGLDLPPESEFGGREVVQPPMLANGPDGNPEATVTLSGEPNDLSFQPLLQLLRGWTAK